MVGVRTNAEEAAILAWLKQKADRSNWSDTYKWAARKVAVEMGFRVEEKSKKK